MAPRDRCPIVVTGTSGLLGGYLFTRWSRSAAPGSIASGEIHGFDRNAVSIPHTHVVDLTDRRQVTETVRQLSPRVIVNCAAMTNVDACEEDETTAYAINAEAVGTLADAADAVGAKLVQISTDAVFGDYGTQPYTEMDTLKPINAYGRSKRAGEEAALTATRALVLRTTIFGWNRVRKKGSFGEWIYQTIREGQHATLFADVFFSPIYIGYFADLLEIAIDSGMSGIYHLAGADSVSKEEFAREMARQMERSDDNLATGTLEDLALRAGRSHNMTLDSSRFAADSGVETPTYRESIAAFLAEAPSP